jgi:subtilisin family serine protease
MAVGVLPVEAAGPAPRAPNAAAAVVPAGRPERVSVLVHLQRGADRDPLKRFAAGKGGHVQYEYRLLPHVVNLRGIPKPALAGLARVHGVELLEEDAEVHAHMNDSTPLTNALQSQLAAAGYSTDGAGVRVCVIDTGIDSDHTLYADRIDTAAGRDFVNDDGDPEDDHGHGSHVAGTVLGGEIPVNFGCASEPFQGMAPRATLIGVKVLNSTGTGSFSDVIAAIDHCADQSPSGAGADVINLSLGGGVFSGSCDHHSAAAAANAAVDAGLIVVASSGNNAYAGAMGSPACGTQVMAVGATYDDDYPSCEFPTLTRFTFSVCTDSFPRVDQIACFSNQSSDLDVVAPGCLTHSASYHDPTRLVGFCGTSMAAPHVSGLAALLLSADPSLTPAEARDLIRAGSVDLGAAGFDPVYGHGRIDAIGSLSLLSVGCTTDADCDDLDTCTTESCSSGVCLYEPVDCSDSDACTIDRCTNGFCSNDPISCDDGSVCTTDLCADGLCSNDPISCGDGDVCTADSCNPVTGCVNPPVNCGDGDPCTADRCDSLLGCVSDPIPGCEPCAARRASCSSNGDCCSGKCRGPRGRKTCK